MPALVAPLRVGALRPALQLRAAWRRNLPTQLSDTASTILAQVLPRWERTLAQGEVLLFGGGGQVMAPAISAMLTLLTPVTLLDDPITRVADGIERLAKYRLQAE
ncbi:MAG: hypothetical protein WCI67_24225 [Chloroflexales bacterium]